MFKPPLAVGLVFLGLAILVSACDTNDTGLSPSDSGLLPDGGAPADTGPLPADVGLAPADVGLAPADVGLAPADTALAPPDTALAPPADTALAPAADTALAPPSDAESPTSPDAAADVPAQPDVQPPADAAPDVALEPDAAPDVAADLAADLAPDLGPPDTAPALPSHYEIRVGATTVPADGYSYIPLVVVGTRPDGSPATDSLTLSLSRVNGGQLKPATVTLTATGAKAFFIPCLHSDAGCTGTVQVQAELTQAPGTIVARSPEVTLIVPTGVGSPAACLVAPNVLFLEGNDSVFNGVMTITDASFENYHPDHVSVNFIVRPTDKAQHEFWAMQFATTFPDMVVVERVYREARENPHYSPDHAGLGVWDEHGKCTPITGEFQVHTIRWSGLVLQEFLATFTQHCNGSPNHLRGCIHYTKP